MRAALRRLEVMSEFPDDARHDGLTSRTVIDADVGLRDLAFAELQRQLSEHAWRERLIITLRQENAQLVLDLVQEVSA
jgi:hypothetical protein